MVRALRPLRWLALIALLLVLIVAGLFAYIDSDAGRGFIVRQIAQLAPANGLKISIGRIEGSVLSRFTAHDVVLSDPDGPFLRVPQLRVAWQPLVYAKNRLVLDSVDAPTADLIRQPRFKPTPPAPGGILPAFDLALGRFYVGALTVEPPVAGRRYVVTAAARAQIEAGRAIVFADARSDTGDGVRLNVNAVPDLNRFDLDARVTGPAGGLLARLAGANAPLSAEVKGAGTWGMWLGNLSAAVGSEQIARAQLVVNAGRFTMKGAARAAPLVGPDTLVARLSAPELRVEAEAQPTQQGVRFAADLASAAFSARAEGALDRAGGSLAPTQITGRLNDPKLLSASVAGAPVDIRATLEGPLNELRADVSLASARLAAGETGLTRPRATGRFTLVGARIEGDAHVTADAASGLPPELAVYANRLTADGHVVYGSGQVVVKPLAIRTDRAQARGQALYDLKNNAYLLALNGAVARYALAGVGEFAVGLDLTIRPGPNGQGLIVTGPITLRTIRLDSSGVRDFIGGLPAASAVLTRGADGAIRFDRFVLAAPKLRLGGNAQLRPNGAISALAQGTSVPYGPVRLAVSGTRTKPRAEIALARPGLGAGLQNVVARIEPMGAAYAVQLTGGSDYGPLALDSLVALGKDGPSADITRARFAGYTASGRVAAAGPVYAGQLVLSGQGTNGTIVLGNEGGAQRVSVDVRMQNATVPFVPDLRIGQGRLSAAAVLRPDGPAGQGTLNAGAIRYRTSEVRTLAFGGRYDRGHGTGRLNASGDAADQPFTIAANADAVPGRVTLAANGSVAGEAFQLSQPALFVKEGTFWRLQPATLIIANGRAILAGVSGPEPSVTARFQDFSLQAISQFTGLGAFGRISGSADIRLPGSGLPVGSVHLLVRDLSRSGVALTSLPINLELTAALRGPEAATRGFIRREGKVLGAFQLLVSPIPGSAEEPLSQRLLSAPMRGLVRLAAPAQAIWPLAGVETLDVQGPVTVNASISGRVGEPVVEGQVRAANARIESAQTGTVITGVQMLGDFNGPTFVLRQFTGIAGSGRVSGAGTVAYDATRGLTANLTGDLRNAQLLRTDSASAVISGTTKIALARGEGVVTGDLNVDRATYSISTSRAATIPTLNVRMKGQPVDSPQRIPAVPSVIRLDVAVRANNRIAVSGMGLDSEWQADVRAGGTAAAPTLRGDATAIRGTFDFAGRSFQINRGYIRFVGENPPNPQIDIEATANVTGLTANIQITGNAEQSIINFTSSPALPQEEVLARLLFGTSVTNLTATDAVQLAVALAQLRSGGGKGFNPVASLKRATGLDRLGIGNVGGTTTTNANGTITTTKGNTGLMAGKYIARDVYIQLSTDAQGYTATQIRVALTRALSLLSTVQSQGSQSFAVQLQRDY
ncbi:MAG: translocation/assembly module TamB domain-containing protein [Sphingomonadaceae bacterium]|nr:translocation/assembly module TamB domain-containing protein [Sphingomonadaceae bacterium]